MFLYALCPNFSLSFTPVLNKNRQALTLIFSPSFPGFALYLRLLEKLQRSLQVYKIAFFFLHIAHFIACVKHENFKITFKIKSYN